MSVSKAELVRVSIERLQTILRSFPDQFETTGRVDGAILIIRPHGARLEIDGDWPMVECESKEVVKVLASNWEKLSNENANRK